MANGNRDGGQNTWFADRAAQIAAPTAISILLLFIWHYCVKLFEVPEAILPTPWVIVARLIELWDLLLVHSWPTIYQCIMGFALSAVFGVGLGILIALSQRFYQCVYPLIVAFQVVPKVALAPLFIVWFGLGTTSRVLLAFVIAFFPMIVNTYVGIQNTDPIMVRMARSFSASRWTIFFKIELPTALPFIFAGLKIGMTFAVIGIIVAEFVTAQRGLGYLMMFAEGNMDMPLLMAALLVLCVVGMLLYAAVALTEKLVITWDVGRKL
jgi:NitT/TauT family transport system permease protein